MIDSVDVMLSDSEFMPIRAHENDAGADLFAAEDKTILPQYQATVKTGVCVDIPAGYVGLVFSRSGMGKRGVRLANCVGVIDSGYQGEIGIMIRNDDKFETEYIGRGNRIAQLVVISCITPKFRMVNSFNINSLRGDKGFGSTG